MLYVATETQIECTDDMGEQDARLDEDFCGLRFPWLFVVAK
jgi:hypothetical protein